MLNKQPQDLRVSRNQQQSRRGSLAKERDDQGSVAIPVAGDGKVSPDIGRSYQDAKGVWYYPDGSFMYEADEDRADRILADEIEREARNNEMDAYVVNQRRNPLMRFLHGLTASGIIMTTSFSVGISLIIWSIVMVMKTSINPISIIPFIIGLLILIITLAVGSYRDRYR
jgi:hypothetical protein